MHVQSRHRYLKFWKNVEDIRAVIGASDSDMAFMMKLGEGKYASYKSRGASVPAESVFSLTDYVPVSFEKVVQGGIDFEALDQHWRGNREFLPRRYRGGEFSKRRTSINAL